VTTLLLVRPPLRDRSLLAPCLEPPSPPAPRGIAARWCDTDPRRTTPIDRSRRHTRSVSVAHPVFASVVERLVAAGCVAASEEAAELLAAAPDQPTLGAWIRRRERGEPLAWITGTMRFCGRPLHLAPGVYVPRIQSEELAGRAAALLPDRGR